MASDVEQALRERLADVDQRLEGACRRTGRSRKDVTLVAVTKTVGPEIAALLPDLGVRELGESRPQELWKKAALVPAAHWHLIGHLQRNKIEQTLPLVHMIHSVDSLRLLQSLEADAARHSRTLRVLLEMNVSREPQKHGFAPEQLLELPAQIQGLEHVEIRGFMTMAALEADPECCRQTFAELRQLRDRLRDDFGPRHGLEHLSMGMTNDFEVAVEEGATLVRLGSVLFAGISEESG